MFSASVILAGIKSIFLNLFETVLNAVEGSRIEMETFIHSNPGLHSRFIHFPDYVPQELCRIFSRL